MCPFMYPPVVVLSYGMPEYQQGLWTQMFRLSAKSAMSSCYPTVHTQWMMVDELLW